MATFETRGLDVVLGRLPFFQGLKQEHLELLAGCARNVRFVAGEFLFREREPADSFFVLREGRVAIELASPETGMHVIQTVQAGGVIGWSWLIPPHHWQFDGRAMEPVVALALDGVCLRGKCDEDHDLGYEMMKRFATTMVERLAATRLQLLDLFREQT